MEQLSSGASYEKIQKRLWDLEQNTAISQRLLDAFPGYYGSYICLHFSGFLTEPLRTVEQRAAYSEILDFLDNIPEIEFPEGLRKYLDEALTAGQIGTLTEKIQKSLQDPEQFLTDNQGVLDFYANYLQSEEYKSSPACQFKSILDRFNRTSGYYDRFLPAMKRLSPAYAQYCDQLERANKMLLERYPALSTGLPRRS